MANEKQTLADLEVDASPLAGFLVDLLPGSERGRRREREVPPTVIYQLRIQQEEYGARVGILEGYPVETTRG